MNTHIHTRRTGSGATVLCLHGLGSASRSYDSLFGAAGPFHCVAWDAPGFGESADPSGGATIEWYAERAAEVIAELGTGPVHVLGNSWGGLIAMQLAVTEPDLVKSLVVVASSTGYAADPAAAERLLTTSDQLTKLGPAAFAKEHAARLLSPNASDDAISGLSADIQQDVRQLGFAAAVDSMVAVDVTRTVKSIHKPTLILWGDADQMTDQESSQGIANAIPDAVFVTLAGAGHIPHVEKADSCRAWLTSFFRIVDNDRETSF